MGNREALLEGARRCLYERGYARTTARDIVTASGTNLASIGYHYGTKEALLDTALIESIAELSDMLAQLSMADGLQHLPDAWDRIMAEFDTHRPLLVAHVEAWSQIERAPELRAKFAKLYADQLAKGVEHALAARADLDADTARAVSAISGILADGLIVQWLIDPKQLPSGRQIATGLRALADSIDHEDTQLFGADQVSSTALDATTCREKR